MQTVPCARELIARGSHLSKLLWPLSVLLGLLRRRLKDQGYLSTARAGMTVFQTFLKFWAEPSVERSSVEAMRLAGSCRLSCFLPKQRMRFITNCAFGVTAGSCRVPLR